MKDRCSNPKNDKYVYYGGRGIKVCEEWAVDFMNFYTWAAANGYQDNLSIDRRDNNENYSPANCRWATSIEQANNKSNNRIISHNGEEHTLAGWSRLLGINKSTIATRLNRDNETKTEKIFRKVGT